MATFTEFKKRDVILYPFPYTNQKAKKVRPCLVLSNNLGEDNILCQITSQEIRKDKYTIGLLQEETIEGSLMRNSYIRCEMLFTANTKEIESRKICSIHKETYKKVIDKIIEIFEE